MNMPQEILSYEEFRRIVLDALVHNRRPVMSGSDQRLMANKFDVVMAAIGSDVRANRGDA